MYDEMVRYITYCDNNPVSRDILTDNIIEKFLFSNKLTRFILMRYKMKNSDKFIKRVLYNANIKIKKICPNAKLICVVYNEKIPIPNKIEKYMYNNIKYDRDVLNSIIWKEIGNDSDIIVVQTKDVTGFLYDKDYKLKEDFVGWHPNVKAWESFVPEFSEKYIK